MPQTKCVTIANARIHAKRQEFADLMLCANLTTMSHRVSAQLDSKAIQRPNKAVYVSHLLVLPQINARPVICVLVINATYLAPTIYPAQLVNVALTISALKCATRTTTVYQVKFATIKERVNLDVDPTVIVQQLKFALTESVNVDLDSLERHSVARTSTNVRKNRVIRAHDVKIHLVRSDVYVLVKPLAIPMAILDVYNRINVVVTLIVLLIWLAYKENVRILAQLHNVDEVLNVNLLITKHCAIVHQVI